MSRHEKVQWSPSLGKLVPEKRLSSGPPASQGPVLRRDPEKERRGDRGTFPASLPRSINHRSHRSGGAGKCTEPERSVVAPDTSLSPTSFSFFQCAFFKPLLSLLVLWLPQARSRSPLLLRVRPPALIAAAAASLRQDSGSESGAARGCSCRPIAVRAPGLGCLSESPTAPRSPAGARRPQCARAAASSPARRRSLAMVAARAPAL